MRLDETALGTWGHRIGSSIASPAVIALSGPLGVGKSVLARAIGKGIGVEDEMPSPTYNLLFRYPTQSGKEVVHLDLYRISSADEVWELGWSELGTQQDVVLIEWPERAVELLPPDHWWIELSIPDDEPMLRDVAVRRVGSPPTLAGFPMSLATPPG